MDAFTERILAVDGWIWQPFATPLVPGDRRRADQVMTGWVQIRRFPLAVRMVFRGAMKQQVSGEGTITQFQALSTALAFTVGNGNIGGVATAILIGGAGAVFWMWVSAAVGMATKYAEAVLGVRYRVIRETGEMASGPMYYMRGIPFPGLAKVLAYLFAFFGACAALFRHRQYGAIEHRGADVCSRLPEASSASPCRSGYPASSHGCGGARAARWHPPNRGGGRALGSGDDRLVRPHRERLHPPERRRAAPRVRVDRDGSLHSHRRGGRLRRASVAQTIAAGVSRGVLSNEAGMGSAPIAHGIAKVNHPSEQGSSESSKCSRIRSSSVR